MEDRHLMERVLGLDKLPRKDKEYLYVTCTMDKFTGLTGGMPAVTTEEDMEKEGAVPILFPFPQELNYVPRDVLRAKPSNIRRLKLPNPFKKMEVERHNVLSNSLMERIANVAVEPSVVPMILSRSAAGSLFKHMRKLIDRFRYNTIITFNLRSLREGYGDKMCPFLTAFNMQFCIPIFNPRRCEGLGLNCELVLPAHTESGSKLVTAGFISMMLSNYKDNLFSVDGTEIRAQREITDEHLRKTRRLIATKLSNKAKAKRKDGNGDDDVKWWFSS
jgi:hypothetical protein